VRNTAINGTSREGQNARWPALTALRMPGHVGGALLAGAAILLAGCTPLHLWETHTTATPRSPAFEVTALARAPVATLGLLAPAALQGFSAALAHALSSALAEASPSIRSLPSHETGNVLNAQGLAAEYAELLAGFGRSGLLERQGLQRIGAALGCRYVLLPGLAEFHHALLDRFEIAGLKLVQSRVTTLRLWLQLWDTPTGQLLWESAGEVTVASEILRRERTVPLDEIAQKLWRHMLQEDLLEGKQ